MYHNFHSHNKYTFGYMGKYEVIVETKALQIQNPRNLESSLTFMHIEMESKQTTGML